MFRKTKDLLLVLSINSSIVFENLNNLTIIYFMIIYKLTYQLLSST
jgi:hypothetical protein